MKKLILIALMFLGALCFGADELSYFVVADSLVEKYDSLPKPIDTVEVLDILNSKLRFYYTDRVEMDKDIREALKDYPQFHVVINNFSMGNKSVQKRMAPGLTPGDSIDDFVWLNGKNIEHIMKYIRPIADKASYSEAVANLLHNMKGVVFADTVMMRRYAVSLLAASLGVCYDESNSYDKVQNVLWSDDMAKEFPLAEKIKQRFKGRCSDDRWSTAFWASDLLYRKKFKASVDASTQKVTPFNEEIPVKWNANGCGCSLYKELNGNVYAIYPYWLAKKGGDTLDFSVVTRIAYYGISAENDGRLVMPTGNSALSFFDKAGYSNFVNVAHEHNVKVDWIIKKSDWSDIGSDTNKMVSFFKGLESQIEKLVNKKNNSLFQRFVSNMTMNGRDVGNRGDGVTLWFLNYPTDPTNTAIFKRHFESIHNKLKSANEFAFLNMMMNQLDLTVTPNTFAKKDSANKDSVAPQRGIYSYEFFRGLMDDPQQNGENLKNFLIELIDEPVSRSKLTIYHDLNQQLKGNARKQVLHAVVPMLWLDFQQWDQLEDDASFYNDAYYSLGVAPYGLINDTTHQEEHLSETLLKNFEKEGSSHERQNALAAFFCTHRWAFRLLNTIVYGLVFLLIICYFVICRLNAFFTKYLGVFVAIVAIPPLLTSLILSQFDPIFMDFVGKVGQWGCFVVIILTVIAIALLQVYRSADLPRRK